MNDIAIWNELERQVASGADPDVLVRWLLNLGYNEIDARRMLQYQMERVQ